MKLGFFFLLNTAEDLIERKKQGFSIARSYVLVSIDEEELILGKFGRFSLLSVCVFFNLITRLSLVSIFVVDDQRQEQR